MIAIALIRLLEAEEAEVITDFAWKDQHPGDKVEKEIIRLMTEIIDSSQSSIFPVEGKMVYLRWEPELQLGITTVLTSLDHDIFQIGRDTYEWYTYSKYFAMSEFSTWEELYTLQQTDLEEELIDEIPVHLEYDWFATSLQGGEIELPLQDSDTVTGIANIFGYFPWSLFFLRSGQITSDKIILSYIDHEVTDIPVSDIYSEEIDGELNETFWFLVYELIIKLGYLPVEQGWEVFSSHFVAIFDLTRLDKDNISKLETFIQHRDILADLSVEFISTQIRQLLFNFSGEHPSYDLAHLLLEFSDVLIELEFTELAKLAEGTSLELILQVDDFEKQEKIILQLTERTKVWGNAYIVGFIQSLTGLLDLETKQQTILAKAVTLVEDELKRSWDGIITLVDSFLQAGEVERAIHLRFEATKKIGDKITHAEDIFTAVVWGLEREISESALFEISEDYLNEAIEILSESETIVDQFGHLNTICRENNKPIYFQLVIDFLRQRIGMIAPGIRASLIERITEHMGVDEENPGVFVYSKLLNFQLLMEDSAAIMELDRIDAAFRLIGTIYNSIDPHENHADTLLYEVTQKIVFSCMHLNNWNLIEDAIRRYSLLMGGVNDQSIQQIYLQAALKRSGLPKSELHQNDIGLRLFNEASLIADLDMDIQLLEYLPKIKQLAIKSQSYTALSNYVIMEIRLKKVHNLEWINEMISDVKILLSKGDTQGCTTIFVEALDLDLTKGEELKVLNAQLNLTENEPDLMSSDEIYKKRMRVKALIGEEEAERDYNEILENYRGGISELISKGDNRHLEDLLVDAISYTIEHAPEATDEFVEILVDSYKDSIVDYATNENISAYNRSLRIFRTAYDKFGPAQITLIVNMVTTLVEANLDLYTRDKFKKFLRRAVLLLKELVLMLRDSEAFKKLATKSQQEIKSGIMTAIEFINEKHPEFGPVEATDLGVFCYAHLGLDTEMRAIIDDTLSLLKKSALRSQDDASPIVLSLLLINRFYIAMDADINPSRFEYLVEQATKTCNFILSSPYKTPAISSMVKEFREKLQNNGHQAIVEFPFSVEQYIREFDQST